MEYLKLFLFFSLIENKLFIIQHQILKENFHLFFSLINYL